jgi:P27 family predicted phage terminase small subunit
LAAAGWLWWLIGLACAPWAMPIAPAQYFFRRKLMGRRPDRPGVQAAKGNSNRRKSANAARDERAAKAEKIGKAVTTALAGDNSPSVLADFGDDPVALRVWNELVPELRQSRVIVTNADRLVFGMFCQYYSQWLMASEDIRTNGYSSMVQTTNGAGERPWKNPAVHQRQEAFYAMQKMSDDFGLSPMTRYKLFGVQRLAFEANPDLLNQGAARPVATEIKDDERPTLIGSMGGLDSAPPGSALN